MEMTMTETITKEASSMKVAATRAASIVSAADSMSPLEAVRRARVLADLNRDFTPEESLEFAALTYGPTAQYIA